MYSLNMHVPVYFVCTFVLVCVLSVGVNRAGQLASESGLRGSTARVAVTRPVARDRGLGSWSTFVGHSGPASGWVVWPNNNCLEEQLLVPRCFGYNSR